MEFMQHDVDSTAEPGAVCHICTTHMHGTGACRFIPLSHEKFGRAGPGAFALLNESAEFAASSGVVSKRIFLENAMRDLSTTLCRGIARHVLARCRCVPI